MRYLYSLAFYCILPFVFLRLCWKSIKAPGYRQRWPERLGFIDNPFPPGSIWIHAVSLGEMILAVPLIRNLKKNYPNRMIIVTTMTLTGAQLAARQGEGVKHFFVPYDLPGAVQRFLKRAQPSMLIIMETELWPNLLHYTARRGIPILLANARLSERSARGYRFITPLTAGMLAHVQIVAAQTQQDADRFRALGASAEQLKVIGSMKFDIPVPEEMVKQGQLLRQTWDKNRPVLIAASTHAGEEEKVLAAYSELTKTWPNALLILVPRHPERFDAVASLCKKQGYRIIRRSEHQACTSANPSVFRGSYG